MNWQAWLELVLAAASTATAPAFKLVTMVAGGVLTLSGDYEAKKELIAKWFAWCRKIVDEKRDPTPEEEAEALAFAEDVHARNQAA